MRHHIFSKLIYILETHQKLHLDVIASEMQVERPTLELLVNDLQQMGAPLEKTEKNEIQLTKEIDLLSFNIIQQNTNPLSLQNVEILPPLLSVGSTNQYLKDTKSQFDDHWRLCLSEFQSLGRGRQGKKWISPFASNVYMSLHCRFSIPFSQIGGISLMVGVAVIDALKNIGVHDLKVKWPNDIYWNGQKLAGILIESTKLVDRCAELIIGIGINVEMPKDHGKKIDQQWVDLNSITKKKISKNLVISEIINQLVKSIKAYDQSGLKSVLNTWTKLDYLYQKHISVAKGKGTQLLGVAVGINEQGELLCKNYHGEVISINSGDVSVREVKNAPFD